MSTGLICLLISAGIMVIVTIYLDIIGEQVDEIKEIAEEQGWADPAKVQKLDERPRNRAAHSRHRQTQPPETTDARYFIMPSGEKVRRR
jgi:hypothetical protein